MGDIVIGRDLTEVVSHILSMQQQNRDTSPIFAEIKKREGNRKLLSVMRLLYAHAAGYETKLPLPSDANTRSLLPQIFYSAEKGAGGVSVLVRYLLVKTIRMAIKDRSCGLSMTLWNSVSKEYSIPSPLRQDGVPYFWQHTEYHITEMCAILWVVFRYRFSKRMWAQPKLVCYSLDKVSGTLYTHVFLKALCVHIVKNMDKWMPRLLCSPIPLGNQDLMQVKNHLDSLMTGVRSN